MTGNVDRVQLEARRREAMRHMVNRQRDVADEMASRYGCDDALHPLTSGANGIKDWVEFVEKVARPLVDADGDEGEQAAMRLFRTVSPLYICASMVMMANRLAEVEGEHDGRESHG